MTAADSIDVADCAPIALVERSGFVESRHVGVAAVLAPDGSVLRALGDIETRIYPRSALKPFQTVAALRAGARFEHEQLVIVTSSHAGEPEHVHQVRAALASHGLAESDLRTPAAWPSSSSAARAVAAAGGTASAVFMNCSGNHTGMLAAAQAAGWSIEHYLSIDHPVHDLAHGVIEEYCGAAASDRGIDGCGGPVWSLSVRALAAGYQRLIADQAPLAAAVRRFPTLIEGAGSATSAAIEATGVVAKSGAEGVWCAVAPDGTTVAIKALDGAGRAAAVAGLALLADAGAIDATAAERLLRDDRFAVFGGAVRVGRVHPAFEPAG